MQQAAAVEGEEDQEGQQPSKTTTTTPLPWGQILIIMLMRLAEPVAFSLIFPFIGDMIWDLGATDDRGKIGQYAGIVESLFALVQTFTVLQWGRASDRLGRKPIILNGLIGSSISTILLGLSTSFPMLVIARCLSGALNGNVAIFKSTIGEMTDRTNSARAFSFLPFTWALGCTLGPLLGGYLSQPAKKYPSIFSANHGGFFAAKGLWERYPYFLPCLVSALLTWSSVLLGIFFLKETLPRKVEEEKARKERAAAAATPAPPPNEHTSLLRQPTGPVSYDSTFSIRSGRTASTPNGSNIANGSAFSATERPRFARPSRRRSRMSLGRVQSWNSGFTPTHSREGSPVPVAEAGERHPSHPSEPLEASEPGDKDQGVMSLLKIPHIRRIMLSYAFLSLTSVALDSVQVIYFWEPISLGGLSYPSQITGTVFSVAGVFSVGLQLVVFPFLQRRMGTLPLYSICFTAFPLVPLILPFANLAARKGLRGMEHEGGFETDVVFSYQILVYVLVGVAMAIKTIAVMAFSCNIILVNQASALAPGAPLGTLNGLAQMSSSLMRAVGPYAASSLFALTLTKHLAGGYLIWILLFIIGLGGVIVTNQMADVEKMVDSGEISADAANPRG